MGRLTFLLRPGWVALAVVVIAFTYLCFSVLAPWQLGKNTKTSRENNQIQQSLTTAPVALKTLLPHQDSSAPDAQWRRVTATGHYLADKQLLVRLRVAEGDPALEVLVPFMVDGGPNVLVDRGYVRPERGSRLPSIPPPPHDTVTITARLRDSEQPVLDKQSFISDGVRQVYSIDIRQIATLTGVPLAGSYLQLVDNQPGGLGMIGIPHLMPGRFCPTASSGSPSAWSHRFCWAISCTPRSRPAAPRRAKARRPRRSPRPSRKNSTTATDGGDKRKAQRRRDLYRPGELNRATQVGYRRGHSLAEGGPDLQFVLVCSGAAQAHAQRSGECRLDDAGVGAGMTGGVTTPGTQRARRRSADDRCIRGHQRRGHARGDVVGRVIQTCCGPTESGIARRAVADHRIECIDGAVAQDRGHAAHRRPQQRRNVCVRGVLGHRFHRGAGQSRGVEPCRVAPAQRGQQPSGALDVVAAQQVTHRRAGARQRRSAQRYPGSRRGRDDGPQRPALPRMPL